MTEETKDPQDQPSAQDAEEDGPPVEKLDEDPAYNPDDPGLKDIKGG